MRKHAAKAKAHLKRAGYADGGDVDDADSTYDGYPRQHQSALDEYQAQSKWLLGPQKDPLDENLSELRQDNANADNLMKRRQDRDDELRDRLGLSRNKK